MMNLYEAIGCRHSVRKYTDREVTEKLRGQILSYFDKTSRLNDRIRVEAVIFDNTKKKADVHGLWKVDAPYYLAIYSDQEEGWLSDGADGALYDGKRDWNLLFGQRAAGAEGARRQTLPDDGRIRLPGGQALP